ncbi:DUF3710 domain-containing protein [Rhodococcus sp. D2-41]|uniref:DUF3710 domain-containing protein n=1 Tax=Speluncibacter jeojiensis TaxID=2710754 RepID=A0A9X4M229_9ACTN|nr:DUF3710 domain-containing protein [Rhodococcus sp. D2-41]MDG3011400.1 DUF3710 domain-containing protein [Rhodococcus sp. D2-41]MDG3016588.1 DUF3710 domain-containing protein [Corynebacteriales bacterium D3-21]
MAFGRKKGGRSRSAEHDADLADTRPVFGDEGPYEATELSDLDEIAPGLLDLGSVLLPMPEGGQIQVEMAPDGSVQALHLVTGDGRITVAAYAAPKSSGQWREVTTELADSLRSEQASVSVEDGPWGRELLGVTPGGDLRFIGVDGPRWMIRCVAAGPTGALAEDSALSQMARAVLRRTIVKRGSDPLPVRTPLPVVLPEALAQQLLAAQQQQLQQLQQQATEQGAAQAVAQAGQAQAGAPDQPQQPGAGAAPDVPRRGAQGSAMQQLDRRKQN